VTVSGRCRAVGLAVGTGVGFAFTRTYLFDLAPVALAAAVMVGMLAGEVLTPRPARRRGTASLHPRRVRDFVAKADLIAIGILGVGVLGFAAYPAPARPDHEVEYFGTASPVHLASTLVTLGISVILAALLAWLIVRSPQAGVNEVEHAADDAWRRAVVRRIVHSCAAIFAVVFTALGFWYADDQLDWRGGGSPAWGFGLCLVAGLGLVTFVRYAGALAFVMPTSDRPMDEGADNVLDGPALR
jgi:hypothetical protein